MERNEFDLIVIGAGINGAGIARDAALRGLRVVVLDKGDLGSGTSSYSTRLIHGGLRYLEHGELRLVREALRERETLFQIAPHLVRPLMLLIPLYEGGRRKPWEIRAGMLGYDVLSPGKSLPGHCMLSRESVLKRLPQLNQSGLLGGASYHDGQVEFAERLVLENVLSAHEHGAQLRTYAQVTDFIIENRHVVGVNGKDSLTGEPFEVRGFLTINAAGPWVDQVLHGSSASRMIGGTKGSHIIVGSFPGAPETALYVEARTDGRPFFIIPWDNKYLIGTTDQRYEDDLDAVAIDDDEIDHLLAEVNHVLPAAKLTRAAILFSYSGVRPLPFTSRGDEAAITRRHFIREHGDALQNLFSIVGGKLTTYRSLAEEAVDHVFARLKRRAPKCRTHQIPLPGANRNADLKYSSLSALTFDHLVRVYGGRASEVLLLANSNADLLTVFDEETGAIAAEVVFSFQQEFARTLSDCLLRRSMVGFNSDAGIGADERAAKIAQQHLGWSNERACDEVAAYRQFVATKMRKG